MNDLLLNQFDFVSPQEYEVTLPFMMKNLNSGKGFFLNRIGGSDYEALSQYVLNGFDINNMNYQYYYYYLCNLNGYFDKSKDENERKKNFEKYLQKMYASYQNSESYMNACAYIQRADPKMHIFNRHICRDKPLLHYYYVEGVTFFQKDFKEFAKNKKILIISPFSQSIQFQCTRLDKLLKNYTFPECTILTYTTPITYNNTEETIDVPTNNWLEQCEQMEKDISTIDFDIALLSCGSYATCLGSYISTTLHKNAIYIGGILNILFNIKGKRYENNEFYDSVVNLEYRIEAIEKQSIINRQGGRLFSTEALNAYF